MEGTGGLLLMGWGWKLLLLMVRRQWQQLHWLASLLCCPSQHWQPRQHQQLLQQQWQQHLLEPLRWQQLSHPLACLCVHGTSI